MVALTHKLFEQQAAHTPNATAVSFGALSLSYRKLNERANQVAHYLQRKGVGPDLLVGVCMERTPLLVIAAVNDLLCPIHLAREAFARAGEPKRLLELPVGHFDPYEAPCFADAAGAATKWFATHLGC